MADETSTDTATTDETKTSTDAGTSTTDTDELGDAGVKALAAWKERAKAAEKDAKRTAALEAELAALKESQLSESEKAIADARKEAAEEARQAVLGDVNRKLFASEVKAATAALTDPDLFADPDVALKLLGLDEIPLTKEGNIDAGAILGAVEGFVKAKPHLAASATRTAQLNQGARSTAGGVDPSTLTDPKKVREWAATALSRK